LKQTSHEKSKKKKTKDKKGDQLLVQTQITYHFATVQRVCYDIVATLPDYGRMPCFERLHYEGTNWLYIVQNENHSERGSRSNAKYKR
jgi:hypothetical protein